MNTFNNVLNKWEALIVWRVLIGVNPKNVVVATNGCFDILHVGHIQMLEEAAKLGTHLVIGLNSDSSVRELKGEGRPINTQEHRKRVLEALRSVDKVVIFNELNSAKFLKIVRPHIYVKAGDYTLETMNKEEREVLINLGSTIVFTDLVQDVSTTKIIKKIKT